jgi:hypothetical protein
LPILGMKAFTIAGVIYAALVLLRFRQRRIQRAAIVMGVGMAFMILILYGMILPHLGFLQLSERMAYDLNARGAYGQLVATIGYDEPSLSFYQGGGTRGQDDAYLQKVPPAQWPRWIVITQPLWNIVPPNLQELLRLRCSETGLNYAHNGQWETLLLMQKRPTPIDSAGESSPALP